MNIIKLTYINLKDIGPNSRRLIIFNQLII